MNIGLAIRDDKEAAFAQPVADIISQPLSRPLRFVGIAQSCFGHCCSAGTLHAFRQRPHLAGEREENIEISRGRPNRVLARPQGSYPHSDTRDGSGKAPANNQQSDGHDHKHLNGHANEDAAPDAENLGANIAAVVNYEDSANHRFIGRVQWGSKHVDTPESQIGEGAYVAIVLHGILQQLSENGERSIQAGRYDRRRVIASIDSDSHQVFAVAGGLDQLLKANAVPGREI